jgi:hypothetical protein
MYWCRESRIDLMADGYSAVIKRFEERAWLFELTDCSTSTRC